MAELVLIRGLCGAGKSTLAKTFVANGYQHFEADMYFVNDRTGKYKFDQSLIGNAHLWCQQHTKKELNEGNSVVVSNTFTTRKELKEYLNMAQHIGVPVRVIKVIGNFQNVHGVPEDVLQKMRDRWQDFEGEEVVDNTKQV